MSGHGFGLQAMAGAIEIPYIIRSHTQTVMSSKKVVRTDRGDECNSPEYII